MPLQRATARRRRPVSPRSARSPLFILLSITFALFGPAPHTRAQETTPHGDEVVRVRTDLVTVPVVVTDARGRRVAGLTRDDFELLD